jgi:hypothetical protein
MTVNEMPLVVRRWPERGAGACYPIEGWVDGESEGVIVWRGTDGDGPWTRVYATEREAMQAVASIESYVNVMLVSATIRPREGTP